MKLPLVKVLLFIVLVMLINGADAWGRFRFRYRLPRVDCPKICTPRTTCTVSILYPHITTCRWIRECRKICKRSVEKREVGNGEFVLRLPCKFETWDTDNDGSVSIGEFAFAGHTIADKATKAVFKKVDINGDGNISKEELDNSSIARKDC